MNYVTELREKVGAYEQLQKSNTEQGMCISGCLKHTLKVLNVIKKRTEQGTINSKASLNFYALYQSSGNSLKLWSLCREYSG